MTASAAQGRLAPPLPELSPRAELALLARMLHREGFDDHLAGHITYRQPDGSLLVNPFGLTWDEIRASDIMRIDRGGRVLDGRWTVTPAIELHLALHRARDDVTVAVHNHPRWATLWADMHRIPPIYDQTGALVGGEVALYDEWRAAVNDVTQAEAAIEALGAAPMALLANHGVLVVAPDIRLAHLRCITLEWRSRQAWHVEAAGGGVPIDAELAASFGGRVEATGFTGLLEAMMRRELRHDASVLD